MIYKNNRDNTGVDNYLRNNAFPSMIQSVHCQQPIQPHTDSEKLKDYC
ncbi:hypothetical protein KZ773_22180 [Escherichia coli]|nr:hypothetical protein [Escherichia coli]